MKHDNVSSELIERAKEALKYSYCPYSEFPVAAAILTGSGKIFAASNVENASYSLTVCAERNAIFHAVSAGERAISVLLLYTRTKEIYTPCGACRQVLAEFAGDNAEVICMAENGAQKIFTVGELLPGKFSL